MALALDDEVGELHEIVDLPLARPIQVILLDPHNSRAISVAFSGIANHHHSVIFSGCFKPIEASRPPPARGKYSDRYEGQAS